jgi:hypothetical protein
MRSTSSIFGAALIGLVAICLLSAARQAVSARSVVAAKDEKREVNSAYITDPLTAKMGAQGPGGVEEPGWQKIDAGAFSVFAPLSWKFHQLTGVDSYVGEFFGDGVVLRFDLGRYSNPLKEEKKPEYVVVQKSIAGLPARIVSPKTPGHGITGIYFPKTIGSNKLCLFGQDLTSMQQELALKIFETIQFGSAVPPVLPPPAKNMKNIGLTGPTP